MIAGHSSDKSEKLGLQKDSQTHKEGQSPITSKAAHASSPALNPPKVADHQHGLYHGSEDQKPVVEDNAIEEQQPLPRQRRRKPNKRQRINVDQYTTEASSSR